MMVCFIVRILALVSGCTGFSWSMNFQEKPGQRFEDHRNNQTSPEREIRKLIQEYQSQKTDYLKAKRQALTDVERKSLKPPCPNPEDISQRILELVRQNPQSSFAPEALTWVLRESAEPPLGKVAVQLLIKDHL